ncbi:Cu(I)-responsive transcriptional regulator [Martelella soudanensis]|uniref:Cu(I)-responsive transcriptional regulator n=1 Tax=unclassified Martelella TaxID=2629616 RepID=UPI0015DE210D|nr:MULTISPECIES: Cu(I)-responsive transcriptional regulator [unclassified Martelella]
MNIGQAARQSGLPPKTIRYYEEIGLVVADRAPNGYRDYSDNLVHRLNFVHRSRDLGFSVEECRLLLSLYDDDARESAEVKALATAKIAEINEKLARLAGLKATLQHLADHCHGDHRPDCPILEELSGGSDAGCH